MSSPSLQAEAVESSEQCSSASGISGMSNGTITASASSGSESTTASCTKPQSSAISAHSSVAGTPQAIKEWLMSLPQDSLASRSASPEREREPRTKETCGRQQGTLFALSSQDSFCLKTCREYADICPWSSETCGDLAMRFDDPYSLGLTMLGRRTEESGYGFWPTPNVCGNYNRKGASATSGDGLATAVKLWPTPKASAAGPDFAKVDRSATGVSLATAVAMLPTPCAQDAKNSTLPISQRDRDSIPGYLLSNGERPGGQLNPDWVEWLMGFPIGWTSLAPLSREAVEDCGSEEWWKAEPDGVPRVASGIPARIDRLKALGNGQVPQVVALAWKILRGEI